MILKDGVNIWGLDISMRPVLANAEKIWRKYGQELVVTSARDNIHSAGSVHYYGYALDFRTKYFDNEEDVWQIVHELSSALGDKYRVIYETDRPGHEHIHVHYRPAYSMG